MASEKNSDTAEGEPRNKIDSQELGESRAALSEEYLVELSAGNSALSSSQEQSRDKHSTAKQDRGNWMDSESLELSTKGLYDYQETEKIDAKPYGEKEKDKDKNKESKDESPSVGDMKIEKKGSRQGH